LSSAGYLLDTNVISETIKSRPDQNVDYFLASIRDQRSFLSVLTMGELRKGAERKRPIDKRRAEKLDAWIQSLEETFAGRIVQVDLQTARLWGELSAPRLRPIVDTLLAATAIVHQLTLVTRNTRDIADTGVDMINPWSYVP
jgi:predicted nucleic acid-binding protein